MAKPTLRNDTLTYTMYLDNTILTKDKKFTFLTGDVASGATSLSVLSISGFSSTAQALLLGELGREKTEIVYPSHATAPASGVIYLFAATVFDHPQDTKVYAIDWDQAAFSRSTGIASQKGTLTTVSLMVDQSETLYRDSTNTTGYGFVEFRDSVGSAFCAVASDPVPYIGYADNTVFMIKKRALDSVNEKIDGEIITHEKLSEALWDARREYHQSRGKRPFRRQFNADLGNVSTGMYRLEVPSDLEGPYTAENFYGIRVGSNRNMDWYDKKGWDQDYEGVAHTVLTTAYAIVDQDVYCSNVRDMDDSGSVQIESDTIAYSAKGVSGGTLRVSTAGKYAHSNGLDVWQGVSMGLPDHFTIFKDSSSGSAFIYFNCPLSTTYVNLNIWGDYYRTLVPYDSDADELDEPAYDFYVPYLAYRIKKWKKRGEIDIKTDADYTEYSLKKQTALNKEYLDAEIRFYPDTDNSPIPE